MRTLSFVIKKCRLGTATGIGILTAVALFIFASLTDQCVAKDFGQRGEGVYGAANLTLTYGALFRVEDQKESNMDENSDDGNRNFDTGLVSSQFKALGELEVKTDLDGGMTAGFFGRGFVLYDSEIYNASNDHDSPFTNNNNAMYGGSLSRNNSFTDKLEDRMGFDVDHLDAFVFVENEMAEHPFFAKLGWHVVSWGESTFIQSGISSVINPADLSLASLPGTEIREILLPVNQVSASYGLTSNLSVSGYYQLDWEEYVLPPAGSYFSDLDLIGDGAENLLLATSDLPLPPLSFPYLDLDRASDDDPKDSGQFGVSLTWFSRALGETEFSLYYINHHMKTPDFVFKADGRGDYNAGLDPSDDLGGFLYYIDTSRYALKYYEDVQLFGFSFATDLPFLYDMAFSGEVAYHKDRPVQTVDIQSAVQEMLMGGAGTVVYASTREDFITAQATFSQNFMMPSVADDIFLLAEVGMVQTVDIDEFYRGTRPGDKFSWGYVADLTLTYYDALGKMWSYLSGTILDVSFNFSHDVKGVSPIAGGSFTENNKSAGVKVTADWNETVTMAVGYNTFWGGGSKNSLADRDNVSFKMQWRW